MSSNDGEVDVLVKSSVLTPEDVEEALRDYMAKKGLKGDVIQKTLAPHEKNKSDKKESSGKDEGKQDVENKSGDDGADSVKIFEGAYSKLAKTKERELSVMEKNATKAMASVQTFHAQQKQLFDEFVLLRQRYDEVKQNLMDTLWNGCCEFHPDLKLIPEKKDEEKFLEDDDRLGAYNLGHMLGEGQFATVKSCAVSRSRADEYGFMAEDHSHIDPGREYAMKIIEKDKIQNLHSLKRMSNEISILYELRNPHIVTVVDVIQTGKCLYIVTEKGGEDLFEFFDEHPDGVPEDWARKIMGKILKGVFYCHCNMICHRDLKPENILVSFNVDTGECDDIKLCDFGLAAHFSHGMRFTDFCGSPGFFAPEMIISGTYFGDKADIWSCGCILLELVLGHEQFCETWMTAYNYEVLQEKQHFIREIDETLERLGATLDFSSALNDFILIFFHLRASERPDVSEIVKHEWLQFTKEDLKELEEIKQTSAMSNKKRMTIKEKETSLRSILFDKSGKKVLNIDTEGLDGGDYGGGRERGLSGDERSYCDDASEGGRSRSNSGNPSPLAGSSQGRKMVNRGDRDRAASLNDLRNEISHDVSFTDPKIVQAAYEQMSAKERKLYDSYNKEHDKDQKDLALPPIEPQTPNVGMARKILLRGADLANKISGTQSKKKPLSLDTPSNSPLQAQLVSPLTVTPKAASRMRPLDSPDARLMESASATDLIAGNASVHASSPSPLSTPIGDGGGNAMASMGSPIPSPNISMKLPVVEEDAPGISSRPMSQQTAAMDK